MGLVEQIGDDFEHYSDEAIEILQKIEDEREATFETLDMAQETFDEAAITQMIELYSEEGIPYQTAVELEELTDDLRTAAGKPRIFENLPDYKRPSNRYETGEIRPEGYLQKIGSKLDDWL